MVPDLRHATPLKTGSLNVKICLKGGKREIWKVKEKPNTKEQLPTIGDAVKEKTAVGWNSRLQKRSQNPLVPRLEEMSLLQRMIRETIVLKGGWSY